MRSLWLRAKFAAQEAFVAVTLWWLHDDGTPRKPTRAQVARWRARFGREPAQPDAAERAARAARTAPRAGFPAADEDTTPTLRHRLNGRDKRGKE